jgi:hypothetical protein
MSVGGRALLLVGSPKKEHSTSAVLGAYITARLADEGYHRTTIGLAKALASAASTAELLAAVDIADAIVLATPLYFDSLPAAVTRALELIACHRLTRSLLQELTPRESVTEVAPTLPALPTFLAVVNLGFPESHQGDTAVDICRHFAAQANLAWAGGLSLGGGGTLEGRPLEERARATRNVRAALDLAAAALAAGQPVPETAVSLMQRPLVRPAVYRRATNRDFNRLARKNKSIDLDARPYAS